MIIHGKEFKFLYTVRASIEISKNLDGHQISSISKIFQRGDQIKNMELIATMAIACNRAYVKAEAFENGTEFNEADVITKELIEDLTMQEEAKLEDEILKCLTGDSKTEIETSPAKAPKGSKKNQSAK
jgi:hypothetical protein